MDPHDQSPGDSRGTRWRDSKLLRVVQIIAVVGGISLIGVYVAARIHSRQSSENAIERFQRARMIEVSQLQRESVDSGASTPVDTTLWANGRVKAYQESLLVDMDLPLAVLRIPSIDLEVPVFDGTDELTLNRGAGHIEGTAQPGLVGNFGVAGHRDGFFRELGELALGETIVVELLKGSSIYPVEDIWIVEPTEVWVLEPTETPSITLVTCYPFYFLGSAPQRYIVRAVLDERGTSSID